MISTFQITVIFQYQIFIAFVTPLNTVISLWYLLNICFKEAYYISTYAKSYHKFQNLTWSNLEIDWYFITWVQNGIFEEKHYIVRVMFLVCPQMQRYATLLKKFKVSQTNSLHISSLNTLYSLKNFLYTCRDRRHDNHVLIYDAVWVSKLLILAIAEFDFSHH